MILLINMKISLTIAAAAALTQLVQAAPDRQALASWFTGLRPEKVLHAINCGSKEDITDLLGVKYKAVSLASFIFRTTRL